MIYMLGIRSAVQSSAMAYGCGCIVATTSYAPCRRANFRFIHNSAMCGHDDYINKLFLERGQNPVRRSWEGFKGDFRRTRQRALDAKYDAYRRKGLLGHQWRSVFLHELIPYDVTYLIIGGGLIGSSIAFWIKQRFRDEHLRVLVVERDDTFSQSSSILGVGAIRQQFSIEENIRLSQFSAEFLRHAGDHLRILDCDPPDIAFTPMGHLFLASTEEAKAQMEKDHQTQLNLGVKVKLFTPEELRLKFPFINVDGILLGSLGLENEGVFDPWALLSALREKNLALGVQYVKAEVTGFHFEAVMEEDPLSVLDEEDQMPYDYFRGAVIKPQQTAAAPRPLRFGTCFNCAGYASGDLARLGRVGTETDLLSVPIPVKPRKRYVFVFYCPEGPGLDMPFLIDPSGVWVRREGVGHLYHCGYEPSKDEDENMDHSNLDVDEDFFMDKIMPLLVERVPSFASLRYKNGWAGYSDMNVWDGAPVIGPHLVYSNFFQVCGFSGNGIQHAMAVGRSVMEYTLDTAYLDINLRRFDMRRLLKFKKLNERFNV